MPFVSRLRNENTGHANIGTRHFLLRWIEIISKCTEIDILT